MGSEARIDRLCNPIRRLAIQGKPQLALEQLRQLTIRQDFAAEELWRLYECFYVCYNHLQDWENFRKYIMASINSIPGQSDFIRRSHYSDYLFTMHYMQDISEADFQAAHRDYNKLWTNVEGRYHERERHKRHTKIRIGYLAENFCANIISNFSIQLLAAYDRSHFEIYCYSTHPQADNQSYFIRENVKGWGEDELRLGSEEKLVQQIYDDEIDILFDLYGHSSGGLTLLVMGHRPAPIQISGIGYMASTGLTCIDYYLSDYYLDPPGLNEQDFSEELLRLPHSHFCYTPMERAAFVNRQRCHHDYIMFGSFNKGAKITDELLQAWAEIMHRVPGSRLLLRSVMANEYVTKKFKHRLEQVGLDMQRIIIEENAGDYYERYLDMDIMLDSYPYTGGGTTCDALYMGTPVISRYGKRHGSRFGYSMLANVGVEELAAPDWQSYIEKAVALAKDKQTLYALQEKLPGMMKSSPIMESKKYVCDMETLYKQIFAKWLSIGN